MVKSIAVIGTLDTKGDQIAYLQAQIAGRGHATMVIDVGVLGPAPFNPSVTREQVAEAAGSNLKDVISLNDGFSALTTMAKGTSEIVNSLYSRGELEGVIALGGSQGTALALAVMKQVPLGIPKILVTTVAYSQLITPDMAGGCDVMMIPWTAGLWGLNTLSNSVLETAAGAISGAADGYNSRTAGTKKIVGITSLGASINRYMNHLKPALEQRGYEVAVFHVTGMSGRIFERAIADDLITVSLDLSAAIELLNSVTGGACSAGPERLEAAGKKGIPQIVSPGAIEAFHWGQDRPLPPVYQSRPHHQHSGLILTVRSSVEEIKAAAKLMAEKLNRAKGAVAVVLPMRGMLGTGGTNARTAALPAKGVAAFRQELMSITLPGMKAFREALMEHVRPEIEVLALDAGFNDPPYAETVLRLFDAMTA